MPRLKLLTLLLAIPVLLCSSRIFAAGRGNQVVVLPTRAQGDLHAEDRARLGDALWAALDRLGISRVPDTDREAVLAGEPGLLACLDRDECQERLGRLLEAGHVIGVSATRTAPTAFRLEVRLFDVDVGQDGARIDWQCTACGIEDVAHRLDTLVDSAVQKDHERPRGTLVIRSSPPNADVQIDGRKMGFTELEHHVFAGPHELVVSRPDLAPERTRVDLGGDQRLTLSFNLLPPVVPHVDRIVPRLVPTPADLPIQPPEHRSRWQLGLGIPLTVLGAGVLGLGVASRVLDGQCIDSACSQMYQTGTPAIIELAVGAATLTAGIALIAVDIYKDRAHRARRRK